MTFSSLMLAEVAGIQGNLSCRRLKFTSFAAHFRARLLVLILVLGIIPAFTQCSSPFPESKGGANALLAVLLLAPRLNINETDGSTRTIEGGAQDTYQISLSLEPDAPVTIQIIPDGQVLIDGTSATRTVVFTKADWDTPRTVAVSARDDRKAEGAHKGFVSHIISSPDSIFNGINAGGVAVEISSDNDVIGISVISDELLSTTESGGMATFTIVLDSEPAGSVTVALSSNDVMEGVVSPAAVVFSPFNWNIVRTVTVTGVDDALVDAAQSYTVLTNSTSSDDPSYNGFNPPDVDIENSDNEVSVNKLIFRTAAKFNGDLDTNNDGNPIPEADAFCNSDKAKPSSNTYKALLVGGTNRRASVTANIGDGQIDWVFTPSTQYFRNNGTTPIFTTNAAGIFTFGTLTNSLARKKPAFWSGLAGDWTTHTRTCTNWTVNTGGANRGRAGRVNQTDATSISEANPRCDKKRRLLCVMQ